MKITVEFNQAQGMLLVTDAQKRKHLVTEAHFRFEGPVPVMDLSHPLVDMRTAGADDEEESASQYMDGSPRR